MKILVTGGAGFIGSHVVEAFQGRADIVVLDNFRTGHRRNLEGLECRLIEASILDESAVAEAVSGVDYLFHLAAMVSVPESMAKPSETVALNVTGLLNVLEAARRAGVKKLVLASSAAVYGEDPEQPKRETQRPDPRSPYAITKLDGEYYCGLYEREGWLPTACLRFFNVFGPRQDPKSAYAAAVPIFIERALKNAPITVFGDGTQTRDFIYVGDIVAALEFAALNSHVTGVFNAGYGHGTSINELASVIVAAAGSGSEIRHEPPRPGDIKHSVASVERLKAAGFVTAGKLSDHLASTLRAFREA